MTSLQQLRKETSYFRVIEKLLCLFLALLSTLSPLSPFLCLSPYVSVFSFPQIVASIRQ